MLVWQLDDVAWGDLGPEWGPSSPAWLILAVASLLAAFALSTVRWRTVLAPLATPPRFARMFSHFLAGQFVSNVLPTSFGGDVVRIARLGSDLRDPAPAFASVTIERLTGWLVLPLLTLTALAFQPSLRDLGSATTTAVAAAVVTLLALMVILGAAANRRWTANAVAATGGKRWLAAIHLGVDALRRSPRHAITVILVGLAFQSLQCVAVWATAQAIGVQQVTLGAALAFFPAAAIMQNAPIGIGGLGIREGAFVLFFGALGASDASAITLGLAVYLLTVLTSALGAPAFAFGGPSARNLQTLDLSQPD